MIRKFEFPTKEKALEFIEAHKSEEERRDFIGPMQFATAWEGEGEDSYPTASTGWMVDTDKVQPLPEWQQYEVTPVNPLHQIRGRGQEYSAQQVKG